MRVLLSAPYVGEIGWELLSWQGRVRRVFLDGGFHQLVVLGASGKAAFYADMPLEYRVADLSKLPGSAYEDGRIASDWHTRIPAESVQASVADQVEAAEREWRTGGACVETLWPDYSGRIWPCDPRHQAFIQFERPVAESMPSPWVALVQRTRAFQVQKNWSAENWNELRNRLADDGIRTTLYPDEAEAAMELLSGCDLAVGLSTGGLHLASLCGCPAVVWSVPDTHLWTPWQMTNRQRYQTLWNPLGTPVVFHEIEDQPTPEQVAEWIGQGLESIGRRTGTRLATASFRCHWRARAFIDRTLVRRPTFQRWPWPVQKLVRYGLV